MKCIYIYCEGQTEEAFINEVLAPYFWNDDIYVRPIICTTKKTATTKYRGGVSSYYIIKNELTMLCKQHRNECVTTMFDYYAMPSNTPSIDYFDIDIYRKINMVEKKITEDIGQNNCFFGLMLHEFESLLFSNPISFQLISSEDVVEKIQTVRSQFVTPEHINNSPETAPSKLLKAFIPHYAKIRSGVIISKDIGIDCLLKECSHFASWIAKIRNQCK